MKICLQNANLRVDGGKSLSNHLYILDNFVGGCLYVNWQFIKREVFASQLYYCCERINNF